MFKSIQKGGRIAAVAIGLVAALAPLATPPRSISRRRPDTGAGEVVYV